jgi:outer membrane receptor protein involved in Fe transport
MPNVERIEVLRGPQSTLFGKNASAGVISVITAEPSMDEMGGSAALTYGNYNQIIAKGFIDGPISDTVGFSLAATVNERDGYFINLESGKDINERGRWGVRGQLLWEPSDSLKFRLIADKDSIDERCCGVGNIVDGLTGGVVRLLGGQLVGNDEFARKQYYDLEPVNEIENSGVSLQIDWGFDNDMQLTSITSFRNHDRFEDSDVDYTSLRMLSVNNTSDIETFTQEIRLSQSLDTIDWMIAGSYFDETVKYDASLNYLDDLRNYVNVLTRGLLLELEAGLGPLGVPAGAFFTPGTNITDNAGQDDTSSSIFGQFDWHISDDVTLTLGGNYTKVEKDAFLSQTNGDFFASLDMVQIGFGGTQPTHRLSVTRCWRFNRCNCSRRWLISLMLLKMANQVTASSHGRSELPGTSEII